jgi:hypothetical protein
MCHYYAEDELFFFTPGDVDDLTRAIGDLLSDQVAAAKRAERGQRKVELLDWSAQIQNLVDAVESVSGEK